MELVKTSLISKNNVKNGFYLYSPIVKIEGDYWFCDSIKTRQPVKDFPNNKLVPIRVIPREYWEANGINP